MQGESLKIKTVSTTPYQDQKPGTSGLRKKVKVFQQENYLQNFVQSIFNSIPKAEYEGKALVVSGDGRYWNAHATRVCLNIALTNGVKEVYIGGDNLLSTPAVSALIRKLNEQHGQGHCFGGIVLSASHNPAGPEEDFGIKFNGSNGGPSFESVTEEIFKQSKVISQYTVLENGDLVDGIDLSVEQTTSLPAIEGAAAAPQVHIVSNTANYLELMKSLFDFDAIKRLFTERPEFKMTLDAMHGVGGPYGNKIFKEIFGVSSMQRCDVLEDFGGGHPDPNLTYAKDLVESMGILNGTASEYQFGAALDGDADRNMILGDRFFVTPSDSVAVIVANYELIPYLKDSGMKGAARSMPTSGALDRVTKKLGLDVYETPTGWKFFGNLLDSGKIHVCGEESFGTGSAHVREKDGIWAVLCWLQILAARNADASKPLVTVEQIVKEHWEEFGRNYYRRYDYENLPSEDAAKVFEQIESQFTVFEAESQGNTAVNFSYTDPVDNSVSTNQGYIFKYADGSRFVFRKSGTGSSGATIRVYLEKFSTDTKQDVTEALKAISDRALSLCNLEALTGRKEPTVIT